MIISQKNITRFYCSMEVKQGYKQTEIGVIPEDWEIEEIDEVANVVGGGTPSTNNPKYWNGSVNWFTPTEVGIKKYLFESKERSHKMD